MSRAAVRRVVVCLLVFAAAFVGCARPSTASAEQDTLRRLPPGALAYVELDVRGVLSAAPEQRQLLLALVPNACVALVDSAWTASFAFWDGPPDAFAIGVTGATLAAVQECLEGGLEQVRRPPPSGAVALGAVALYGERRTAARNPARPPGEPTPEEIEVLVTGVPPPARAETAEQRDEEPTGLLLLAAGPRTHLLVSPSLVPRMTALRDGVSLADAPLLGTFRRLPEGQLVAVAALPPGLRDAIGRMLREAGLAREIPEPTAAGLSLALQRARMRLRVRLETADETQAARLVDALQALRGSVRAVVAGLATRPTAPSGLGAVTQLLDELQLAIDGSAVNVAVSVDDALAALATLGVVGSQAWLSYLALARLEAAEEARAEALRQEDLGGIPDGLLVP